MNMSRPTFKFVFHVCGEKFQWCLTQALVGETYTAAAGGEPECTLAHTEAWFK